MFPYDVTSGRLQGIVGNLFAKSETLQFYNTGFYLHNDRLLFVSGPLDLSPDANCLSSLSLRSLRAFVFFFFDGRFVWRCQCTPRQRWRRGGGCT